MVGASLHCFA